ncbi:hypothetical protein MAH1_11200 [Sessilibacter sp. MAH1]
MSTTIIYREATLEDLPILLVFEQGIISSERPYNPCIKPDPVSYYSISDLIESDYSSVVVAQKEQRILASGYAKILPSKPYLTHKEHVLLGFMYVDPEFRGMGLNAGIIEQLVAWSKSKDINDIYLEVYSENTAAISAYQKAGFKPHITQMKLN